MFPVGAIVIAPENAQVGTGDYSARADVHTRDELEVLASAVNRMAEQVRERDAAEGDGRQRRPRGAQSAELHQAAAGSAGRGHRRRAPGGAGGNDARLIAATREEEDGEVGYEVLVEKEEGVFDVSVDGVVLEIEPAADVDARSVPPIYRTYSMPWRPPSPGAASPK